MPFLTAQKTNNGMWMGLAKETEGRAAMKFTQDDFDFPQIIGGGQIVFCLQLGCEIRTSLLNENKLLQLHNMIQKPKMKIKTEKLNEFIYLSQNYLCQ